MQAPVSNWRKRRWLICRRRRVGAPEGAHVFSLMAAPDGVVRAGQPVIEWIDCSVLLVDVPVPDADIALIDNGDQAEVVLEGEPFTRTATVLLTRVSDAQPAVSCSFLLSRNALQQIGIFCLHGCGEALVQAFQLVKRSIEGCDLTGDAQETGRQTVPRFLIGREVAEARA